MTEDNETQNADLSQDPQDLADGLPENSVVVEDAGTLKKKITVTVHADRIEAKTDEMYGELRESAQIPGFRVGRAPRRLIEKRFGREVAGDVKNALIGEALGQAIEEADLKTLGEPEIELDQIELPEKGDMEFSFEVEIQPEFDLPELEGIEIKRVKPEVSDERLEEYMDQIRESRADLEDTDEPAQEGDVVQASAVISGEGIDAVEHPGLTLRVAAGQVEGLPLVDLGEALAGKKAGDEAELTVTAPESHENEDWQGKELTVKITLSGVRRRKLPELDNDFAKASGFDDVSEMKEHLTGQLRSRMEMEAQRSMRDQVCDWLLEQVDIDVPEGVAKRHTAQTLQRQSLELLRMGVPRERIAENITHLQASATQQAKRDLKLQFILGKIIEQREIEVGEDEVNARIAQMAVQYNRRPERLRQELAADGSLDQVHASLAEEKALTQLMENAEITEVTQEEFDAFQQEKQQAQQAQAEEAQQAQAAETGETQQGQEEPAQDEAPQDEQEDS